MAKRKKKSDELEEALLNRIGGKKKGNKIAIAKSVGLIKQSGKNLVLTDKGRKAARKVKRAKK